MGRRYRFVRPLVALLLWSWLSPAVAQENLTLIYSGNLDGELEPCGCSDEGNFGGIKRRASLLATLRTETPGLIALSAGGLLSSDGPGDRLKGEYILKGFAALGYDAVGLQWRDLAYGTEFVAQADVPWVVSNWQGNEATEIFASQRSISRAGHRVVFFSWLDPEASPMREAQGTHSLASESAKALNAGLKRARQAGGLTVLATTQTPAQLIGRVDLSQVDILMQRAAYEVYGEPKMHGSTLVIQPGSRGMRLGRLDLDLADGRIKHWRHTVLPMPESIPDAPGMQAWYDEYNARVKADYLKKVDIRKARQSGQSPFVGEERCQQCHVPQHETWFNSQHAVAYEDLEAVNKAFDPACIRCHTVGFDLPGGFVDMNITGHLLGVQCESCHGAGRAHAEAGGRKPLANAGWAKEQMCAQCHTQPHSPGFKLDRYWPKIAH
ncbi:MAG: hypothetical protein GXP17_07765 [Gammaproteobacteria bacterium]|nr:hypothetical protein [Gammaproteobacteria bacterium]